MGESKAIHAGPLRLSTSHFGETCLIQLEGELDLANAGALEKELSAALRDGAGQIVVDMSELSFIDSTGIALLVAALGDEQNAGRLRFLRSKALAVTRVLEVTGIDDRLPFVDGPADGGAPLSSVA